VNEPVSLGLHDAAGRVAESQLWPDGPAGNRTALFGEHTRPTPGVYFLRVTQGATSVARRVVVTE
jgi:hypothetical protein